MKTAVGAISSVGDPSVSRPAPAEARAAPAPAPAADLAAVRLVIEESGQSGTFVYKTLDRVTGEVLSQTPGDEVLRQLARGQYSAGDVIKTRA
jgi:flagellar protein FlaG